MPKVIMPKVIMPKVIMPKAIMPKVIMPKVTMPKNQNVDFIWLLLTAPPPRGKVPTAGVR
jgi:hypothetical protein